MPVIQNFSVPAGDDVPVTFVMDPGSGIDINTAEARWRAFQQENGVPLPATSPILDKTSLSGGGIELVPSPLGFIVTFAGADTVDMLRNYYHEAEVTDAAGHSTLTVGIMTVTQTEPWT